jgi:hypothetical protein
MPIQTSPGQPQLLSIQILINLEGKLFKSNFFNLTLGWLNIQHDGKLPITRVLINRLFIILEALRAFFHLNTTISDFEFSLSDKSLHRKNVCRKLSNSIKQKIFASPSTNSSNAFKSLFCQFIFLLNLKCCVNKKKWTSTFFHT